jgi:ribA/ribD-fused uncharacterized protein
MANEPDEMISEFSGDHRWLSNFWPADVELWGITYPTAENAYQAAKCAVPEERHQFAGVSPGVAKRLGRRVRIRSDWEQIKMTVMELVLRIKFVNNPEMLQKLKDTGSRRLVEGNTWGDTFWGSCKGKGQNNLGLLLMKVRKELGGL